MASRVNDEGTSEIEAIEIVINENQSDLSKSTEEGASTTNKPRRTSIFTLGKQILADEIRIRDRIKRTKILVVIFAAFGILIYILNSLQVFGRSAQPVIFVVTVVVAVFAVCSLWGMFYKNSSRTFLCRILKEIDTCIMICGGTGIVIIDTVAPYSYRSVVYSIIYVVLMLVLLLTDTMIIKDRVFISVSAVLYSVISLFNLYEATFTFIDSEVNRVLFSVNNIPVYKQSVKRSLFLQVYLFTIKGLYTMFKDKKLELLVFATGHTYKDDIVEKDFGMTPVEIKQIKDRLKYAEAIMLVFMLFGLITWAIVGFNGYFTIVISVFAIISISGMFCIYFKNISFKIGKHLAREVNVVMIFLGGIAVALVDILKPYDESSAASGLIYLTGLVIFLSLDMVKFKSRTFVMAMSLMELSWTAYLIYHVTFANTEVGVVVFTGVGGMPFFKRSVKRTLYTQVFLFSLDGIRTIAVDKSMEMMIFTTGHVYRATGTSSAHHNDEVVVNSETFKLAKIRTKSREMILGLEQAKVQKEKNYNSWKVGKE